MDKKELKEEIISLKSDLVSKIDKKDGDLSNKEAQKISRLLDKKIIEYMKK